MKKKLTWRDPVVSVNVDAAEVARAQAKPAEVSKSTQNAIRKFFLLLFRRLVEIELRSMQNQLHSPSAQLLFNGRRLAK